MSVSVICQPRVVKQQRQAEQLATLIFLHGSGASADEVASRVRNACEGQDLEFGQIKIIYPSAPERPYTLDDGKIERVWFDRIELTPTSPEMIDELDTMSTALEELIKKEMEETGKSRIILGGHSMGGCMALHMVYRHHKDLAGCFALSTFLAENSSVYEGIKKSNITDLPPLFMCNGMSDPFINDTWGLETARNLRELGLDTEFHLLHSDIALGGHDIKKQEIALLKEWISRILHVHE